MNPGSGRYQFPGGGWPAGRTPRAYGSWEIYTGTASQQLLKPEEGTYHSWRCGYHGRNVVMRSAGKSGWCSSIRVSSCLKKLQKDVAFGPSIWVLRQKKWMNVCVNHSELVGLDYDKVKRSFAVRSFGRANGDAAIDASSP